MSFQNHTDHLTVQVSWPAGPALNYSTKSVTSTCANLPFSHISLLSLPHKFMESVLSGWNSASPVVTRASTGLTGCVYSSLQPWCGGKAWLSSAQLLMVTFTIICGCRLVRHQQAVGPQQRWRQTVFFCLYIGGANPYTGGAQSKGNLMNDGWFIPDLRSVYHVELLASL